MLLAAVEGYRMPVNGKHAKINPVPIREMNAECRDLVGHNFPSLKLRIIEEKNAKNPANT
jgi:hypothetical protein